jgi:uncharacterized membrane protein
MFIQAYKRALEVILKKPVMLWALSLLLVIVSSVGGMVTATIPFLSVAVGYLFACGSAKLYLDGLAGKKVNSKQLFYAFNKNCVKTAGAMAWKDLWTLIWAGVPIANIVKSYSYSFVPYIVVTNPEISAFDALKVSMKMTKGKKGQMFLADLVFGVAPVVVGFVLGMLSAIPVIGVLFSLAAALFVLAIALFGTIFAGLYKASFYNPDEVAAAYAAVVAEQADPVAAE